MATLRPAAKNIVDRGSFANFGIQAQKCCKPSDLEFGEIVTMAQFSHLDESGKARMVDVTEKSVTVRTARARGRVKALPETLRLIQSEKIAKGNPLEVARIAGIMAAKNTSGLIPLCHPLGLTHIDVQFQMTLDGIELEATAAAEGKTGVEMEALMAVSIAALTIYDMCKAVDREMIITDVRLVEKSGGRSGLYLRKD